MFAQHGLFDWKVQRISAVYLALVCVALTVFFCRSGVHYPAWRALFELLWVKWIALGTVLSLLSHVWIGIWTIATDYMKSVAFRFWFLAVTAFALLANAAWAIQIVWSV